MATTTRMAVPQPRSPARRPGIASLRLAALGLALLALSGCVAYPVESGYYAPGGYAYAPVYAPPVGVYVGGGYGYYHGGWGHGWHRGWR